MPPRKLTTREASQKSLTQVTGSAAPTYERKPLPTPHLPEAGSVPRLWVPPTQPRELFPEWPAPATLVAENWGSDEALYDDPHPVASPEDLSQWKRPRQFLPPIVEPTPTHPVATLAPVVPDPKNAKKGGAPAPAAKKGEPEPPKKPKTPAYAHIVFISHDDKDHHHQAAHPTATTTAADIKKNVPPATPSGPPPATITPPPRRIVRDFRRLWSAEQAEELALWRKEEDRIEQEKQQRERVYMEFEDATAFIINGRPRQPLNEENIDPEDLQDDGEDEDFTDEGPPIPLDNSPYGGILPPPPIDISGNPVVKPEIPHGQVVQPEFASYYRLVDQLFESWFSSPESFIPYLWESIHPQDQHGIPIYNPGGKYSVRLFVAGKWRRVDVDDKFPVDEDGYIMLGTSGMRSEIWAAILTKALLKVAKWLGVYDDQQGSDVALRLASTMVTALTGLKVTVHHSADVFKGDFQSLAKYIPHSSGDEYAVQNELVIDTGEETTMDADSRTQDDPQTPPDLGPPKPRAVLCCTSSEGYDGHFSERELSLIVDVVGDTGNATLKAMNLDGLTSISEEALSPHGIAFLVVHPPSHCSDLLINSWAANHSGAMEPFGNPPIQFCVVSGLKRKSLEQAPGDLPTESLQQKSTEDAADVVFTLHRFPPEDTQVDHDDAVAKHLHVDPKGSAILIEDLALETFRQRGSDVIHSRRPRVFKIDTTSSLHVQLSKGEIDSVAFRLHPQRSLRYGYSLQVESSDAKVDWQISNTYWRNVWDLQVIDADGAYPVMLEKSWNILFKQAIEVSPASDGATDDAVLHIDLHLSDQDVVPFVHVYAVSHGPANTITPLSQLYGQAKFPPDCNHATLIVECSPTVTVPEGKWHLTLGCNRFFKHASVHQPRLTRFGGVYEPNKPLTCFRDVLVQPKSPITSLQFELLSPDGATVVRDLAAKLDVIDAATGESQVHNTGRGLVRLLQLPPLHGDKADDKSGYILEASIDHSQCHVPDSLRSVRPYSYKKTSDNEAPKETPIMEEDQAGAENSSPPQTPALAPHQLRWRLSCWSVEEVKLEFDRTEELKFDAIRASWIEAARDRDAHGASSRLFFLGKADAAETTMTEDGLTEEQIAKYKARFEWLSQAAQCVPGHQASDHIDVQSERAATDEVLWTAEDLAEQEAARSIDASAITALQQSIRDQRVADKDSRANELKDLVQWIKDTRRDGEQHRQELMAKRDLVRHEAPAHAS